MSGGLGAGNVYATLGARVDTRDFERFDREVAEARRKSARPIDAELKGDFHRTGFDQYSAAQTKARMQTDATTASVSKSRGMMKTMFAGAAFGVAAAGFYGVAKASKFAFDQYKESEKIGKQTEAVLKSTGGAANVTAQQIGNLANSISAKTGIDDEAIQSGENLLLTFTNIRNEQGKGNDIFNQTTRIMTDMSAALGQDTKSSALQLGKALNNPIKGVTALQRVGVSFTDKQKEQIKTLVESGRTMDAQKLILRELNKEFGGSAAATATNSGRLKVALGNLAESIGGKLSPVIESAAGGLNNLIRGMSNGTGKSGAFAAKLSGIWRGAGNAVKTFVKDNTKSLGSIGRSFSTIWNSIRTFARNVGRAFSETFGGRSGVGKDIRAIVKVLTTLVSAAVWVQSQFVARMVKPLTQVFRGLLQMIRGVVRIIAGVLTLNFGKAWAGVKDIFSGAVKVIIGTVRAATAPIRSAATAIMRGLASVVRAAWHGVKDLFSDGVRAAASALRHGAGAVGDAASAVGDAVWNALSGLPGKLAGLGRSVVSAFANALRGLPGAIGNALSAGGNFLSGIGRGIANWINAHTPFGDRIKIGPVSVTLPALARGGVVAGSPGGRVGPESGGWRAFIAGEGSKDEWVISQEGDRKSNIGWAVEALRTLTGKNVALHRKGKGAAKPYKGGYKQAKKIVSKGERGIAKYDRKIELLQKEYGTRERELAIGDESDFTVENDDGSVTIDTVKRDGLIAKLNELIAIREQIRDTIAQYQKAVAGMVAKYARAIATLKKTLKRASKAKRPGYQATLTAYSERMSELKAVGEDLGFDYRDSVVDLRDLTDERAEWTGATNQPAPTTDDDSDSGGSDSGGGSSAADIATAAADMLASFNANRSDLFANFGQNFARLGSGITGGAASPAAIAAGLRYFGATGADTAAGAAAGPTVTINNSYAAGPADPHVWSQQTRFELEAAIG